jgi:hypothetical protein
MTRKCLITNPFRVENQEPGTSTDHAVTSMPTENEKEISKSCRVYNAVNILKPSGYYIYHLL